MYSRFSYFSSLVAALPLMAPACAAGTAELADYVNTLQGTNSRFELTYGNTYPTVALPWGMHTWTPQTGRNGDGWKYQYHKETIRGFQQAHQCSSWSNDYAVFSLMPVVGELVVDEDRRATKFKHADEIARPHYYRVKLASRATVEMSPTERGAFLRFEFPPGEPGFLTLDGYTGRAELQISKDKNRITGSVRNGRNQPRGFRNHFVLECDQQVVSCGTWRSRRGEEAINPQATHIRGRRIGGYLEFAPGAVVNLKVASSYIDPTQAERNLERELGSFSTLEAVTEQAKRSWNETLAKVRIEGGSTEQKRTFYSCLFRACLFPRTFFEIDDDNQPYYRSPYDGKIHEGRMYTDTGLWDTFRAQMPLNTILHPTRHGHYMQALLDAYEQCGWLPSWSFPGEAGSMVGNHAISLLADAWVKGIRTFDPNLALEAYEHETSAKGPWGPANGRGGSEEYNRLGYLPYPGYREATAKTLEYTYDDFCGYQLARKTGNEQYAERLAARMFHYRNVFDPTTGFMRGKNREGQWAADFDPAEWGGPYTEGCAWHWVWSVFHDVEGLIQLLGGKRQFTEKLDAVFTTSSEFQVGTYGAPIHEMREMVLADLGQYAHGNQPMQHMIYLYNYAGQPWKAQAWARTVMERLYNSTENGYPGDEDQGQTSSWYVFSALGFYSVCPGTDQYVLGSPLFDRAILSLENGNTFEIEALNQSPQNTYIQSARLNGEDYTKNYIRHSDIVQGGRLELSMGPEPNKSRGIGTKDLPFSISRKSKTPSRITRIAHAPRRLAQHQPNFTGELPQNDMACATIP